jgi:hypothetical protein
MFDNPEARAKFGQNGRAYADLNFDISVVADRFMDVFSRAIQRRSSSF